MLRQGGERPSAARKGVVQLSKELAALEREERIAEREGFALERAERIGRGEGFALERAGFTAEREKFTAGLGEGAAEREEFLGGGAGPNRGLEQDKPGGRYSSIFR